jgi:hypothetical protein
MPDSHSLPYLEKLLVHGAVTVWSVDGAYIRAHLDEEFTNFGQHYRFPYIPDDEFWIDHIAAGGDRREVRFFIDHLLVEHRLMTQGTPYEKAIVAGDLAERAERRRAGDVRKVRAADGLPDPSKVHVKLWKHLASGVSVWIVNGRLVRSAFDIDYTEGGHDHVYEFVPHNEVWIDNDVEEAERGFVLLHELHERNLMATGWDYAHAHADSSRVEYHCRHHPDELHDALAAEGWA